MVISGKSMFSCLLRSCTRRRRLVRRRRAGRGILLEQLEPRVLLSAAAVTAGNLSVTDVATEDNNITFEIDGANLRISDTAGITAGTGATQDGANSVTILLTSLTGDITIDGGDGTDVVTFDSLPAVTGTLSVTAETGNLNTDLTAGAFTGGLDLANVAAGASIQDGVALAASGGTVDVAAGTFNENVTVGKWVTVDGAGSGDNPTVDTIISPTGGDGIGITGAGNSASERLTIQNLSIRGANNGVSLSGSSFVTLDNVIADGNTTYGINLGNSTDTVLNNVNSTNNAVGLKVATAAQVDGLTVTGGHFDNNTDGIYVGATSGITTNEDGFQNVSITGTTFNNNPEKGIYLEKANNLLLDGITVMNSGTTGTFVTGVDVNLKYGNFTNVTIQNSLFDNSGTGEGAGSSALAIKARDDGPSYDSNPATLDGVTISGNVFTNVGTSQAITVGEPGKSNALPANLSITNNDLSDGTSFAIANNTSGVLDASGNWWGITDASVIETLVSGDVDFSPYLLSGDSDLLTDGFQGDFSSLQVTALGAQVGGVGRIQEGIDLVDVGGTVNVSAGTFTEFNIDVNKWVTIDGAGSGTNPAVDTIVDGTNGSPTTTTAFTITGSGNSAAEPLTIQDLHVEGSQAHAFSLTTSVSDITLQNVSAAGNEAINPQSPGPYGYKVGVWIQENATMSNLVFDQMDLSGFFGGGFYIGGGLSGTPTIDGFTLTNSTLTDNRFGLHTYGDASLTDNENGFTNVTITGNTLIGNYWKGLYFEKLDNALIQDNILQDNGLTLPGFNNTGNGNTGVELNLKYGSYSNVQILDNTFDHTGVRTAVSGNDVSGAIAIKPRDTGSYATNPASLDNVTVSGNFFTDLYNTNVDSNEEIGRAILIGETGAGTSLPTNLTISNNQLSDGTFLGVVNTTSGTVDATNNWWGTTNPNTIEGILSPGDVTFSPFADIALTGTSVAEGASIGTTVATLSTTGVDPATFVYSLVSGDGDTGNLSFAIVGDQLQTTEVFDREVQSSYSIRIRSENTDGFYTEEVVTIDITDVNDNVPVVTPNQTFSVAENAANGASVGTVAATDGDGNTLSAWLIISGNDDGIFAIDGTTGEITVVDNANLDYETTTSYSLDVIVFDGLQFSAPETVTVDVTNVNDNVPVITPGQSFSISEDATTGTSVGTAVATDADGNTLTPWVIVSGNSDGVFGINPNSGEITIANDTNLDFETTASYSLGIRVFDGQQFSATETVQIDVTNVNDTAPVIAPSQSFSISEDASNSAAVGTVVATDVEGGSLSNWQITGGDPQGVFSIDSSTGAITVVDNTTLDRETTASYSLSITVSDGTNTSAVQTVEIDVTDVDDTAPVITGFSGSVDYSTTVILDADASVTDADSGNFAGGQLVVTLTANADVNDRLVIRDQGTSSGKIGVSGNQVTYSGTVIGTFSGGTGSTPLTIDLQSTATHAATTALLRNIQFDNVSVSPSTSPRTVEVTLSDGNGSTSTAVSKTINVVISDPPVISNFSGSVDYLTTVIIDSDASVTDTDSANFAGGQLVVTVTDNAEADDRLVIRNQGTTSGKIGVSGSQVTYSGLVIGTFSGGTGGTPLTINLKSTATLSATTALLRNIQFDNVSSSPSTNPRTVEVTLNDGDGSTSATVSKTINVMVSTPPTINNFSGSVNYPGSPTIIDVDASVTDPDSGNFAGGQLVVTLTANADVDDRLVIRNQGTTSGKIGVSGNQVTYSGLMIGTFSGGTGSTPLTINLKSSATHSATTALLRNLQYQSLSSMPPTAPRTVQITLNDGDGSTSAAVSKTINVLSDPPVINNFSGNVLYEGSATIIDSDASVTDVDSGNFAGGQLVIALTANADSDDRLVIRNQGTTSGLIGVSGNQITYSGLVIGTFSGGTGSTPLTINLKSTATHSAMTALLRNIQYDSVAVTPPTAPRTVEITLNDGDGGTSTPVNKQVQFPL